MKEFFEWISQVTGADINTVFTFVSSVFFFCLGVFAAWISKKIRDSIDRKNYRNSLNHIIYNCAINCKVISTKMREIANNTGFIGGTNYVIPTPTTNTIAYLNNADLQLLTTNYLVGCRKQEKAKAMAEFYNKIGMFDFYLNKNKNIEKYVAVYENLLRA